MLKEKEVMNALRILTVEHHTVTRATRYSVCALCGGESPQHLPGCPEDPVTVLATRIIDGGGQYTNRKPPTLSRKASAAALVGV